MTKTLTGRGVVGGRVSGPALVTRMPLNFTATLTKPANLLPGRRAEIQDRHHDLFREKVDGKVLVFPTCIGSTYTGLVLLELMARGVAPAALVVQEADPLLVSGVVLAEVWYARGVPLVEYGPEDLFEAVRTGDRVTVDGDSGVVVVEGAA